MTIEIFSLSSKNLYRVCVRLWIWCCCCDSFPRCMYVVLCSVWFVVCVQIFLHSMCYFEMGFLFSSSSHFQFFILFFLFLMIARKRYALPFLTKGESSQVTGIIEMKGRQKKWARMRRIWRKTFSKYIYIRQRKRRTQHPPNCMTAWTVWEHSDIWKHSIFISILISFDCGGLLVKYSSVKWLRNAKDETKYFIIPRLVLVKSRPIACIYCECRSNNFSFAMTINSLEEASWHAQWGSHKRTHASRNGTRAHSLQLNATDNRHYY